MFPASFHLTIFNGQLLAINDVTAGSRRWLSYLLYRIRTVVPRYSGRSVGRINFRTAIAYIYIYVYIGKLVTGNGHVTCDKTYGCGSCVDAGRNRDSHENSSKDTEETSNPSGRGWEIVVLEKAVVIINWKM